MIKICISCLAGGVLEDSSATGTGSNVPYKLDSDSSVIMDMILEDDEHDFSQLPTKFGLEMAQGLYNKPMWGGADKFGSGKAHYLKPQNSGSGTINWGPPPPPS